jgi:hypothetical protein
MNAFRGALGVIALFSMACVPPLRAFLSPRSGKLGSPSAVITDDFAQFVFPNQDGSSLVIPVRSEQYAGEMHRYLWEARWPVRQAGVDPQSIVVTAEWATSQPPKGPLKEIVGSALVEVLTLCRQCVEYPALSVSRDQIFNKPAIAAQTRGGTVVVTVRGRAAISRLFPSRPDSVDLTIYPPDREYVHLRVAVQKPFPAASGRD